MNAHALRDLPAACGRQAGSVAAEANLTSESMEHT
jgi:hypothetical protein